ncbi:MAG: MotA/TolQ/ExbB proton channel family protein [Pseudomonadota bacterium]
MFKLKSSLKAIGAAAALAAGSLGLTAPASAQNLNDILNQVRQDSDRLSQENEQRLREFTQARDEQQARMESARQELAAAEARGRELTAQFEENEAVLGDLQAQLEEQAGDFGELLGQFRQAAGETMPILAASFTNFEESSNPVELFGPDGRVAKLSEISQARALPTRSDLDSLPKAMLLEMIAQSEVKPFTATVANAGSSGENVDVELFRIGVFTAATTQGTRFVEVIDPIEGDTYLSVFGSQPTGAFRSAMSSLINAGEGAVVRAPVDPSKGALFGIFGDLPTLGDRLEDGGPVGVVIMILLAIGAAIALFKIVTLFLMNGAMSRTAKTKQAGDGNPLARVFETYEQHKNDDMETLELKLDEQILRDTPKIERFNDIVKVLAAVAPLLGLLGTVIGMIQTFTAITIYGAGDPQLMADGISVALMTTVLGLVAAIPLLLLHAISSSIARGAQQTLDEQAAGLVAEKAERSGAAA